VDSKSFSRIEVKSADAGQVTAVFSTFDVLDSDGDITLKGAFTEGAEAPISAYGHTSWGGALPVGKARLRTSGKEAILDGQFFMDTTHGRDAFLTVKQLGGLGQWSYGYRVLDASFGEVNGQDVRYLKSLAVDEFSPVLVGAGVNTRTLATKGLSPSDVSGGARVGYEYKAAIKPHDTEVTAGLWDAAAAVKSLTPDMSVSDLRSMFAWVDPDADPEVKSSYRFAHHTKAGGPANIRACIIGISALNGARGGTSIPEADRKGVYNHLAGHLRDADREPPELRSGSADGLKFNDELSLVLCELDSLLDRASEVVALRAKKGRTPLSLGSSELMDWLDSDLRRLKFLLTPTEDEAAYEYLRFARSMLGEQTS
jgi:phage head maturation protease